MAANDLIQVLAAKLFGLPVLSATHEGRDAVRPKRAETTLQNYNFSTNSQGDGTKNHLFYMDLDLVPFWNQFDWKGKDLGRKLFAFSKMGLEKAVIMGQVIQVHENSV